jgi:anti-sigma B factor antagonist
MAVVQSVEGAGAWARIRFAGEIDVATTELVRETITLALAEHPDASVLEIDMTDVTLIDSTGVGVLVSAHRALADNGIRLIVTNPAKIVERVLKVTGVYETLTGSGVSVSRRRGSGR